jgi:hypothetical protein
VDVVCFELGERREGLGPGQKAKHQCKGSGGRQKGRKQNNQSIRRREGAREEKVWIIVVDATGRKKKTPRDDKNNPIVLVFFLICAHPRIKESQKLKAAVERRRQGAVRATAFRPFFASGSVSRPFISTLLEHRRLYRSIHPWRLEPGSPCSNRIESIWEVASPAPQRPAHVWPACLPACLPFDRTDKTRQDEAAATLVISTTSFLLLLLLHLLLLTP